MSGPLIQLHRMPVVGEQVTCPPDRGHAGYTGKVFFISKNIERNIHGVPYVWVTVTHPGGQRRAVWPSHRLGFNIRHLTRGAPTPTAVPSCRLHIDHELDPKYHE